VGKKFFYNSKNKNLHLALEEGKMKVKKVLSLLTLIFLIFFLVIPVFPGGNPVSDADPWNETTIAPVPDDVDTVIIIVGPRFIPLVPYFVVMKVQIPSTPKVTGGSGSTQVRGSS
jgi:hypothetical protein